MASWRLGVLKFFSFEQISPSKGPEDQDAGGLHQGKFEVKSGRNRGGDFLCKHFFHRQVAKEDKFLDLNIVPRVCPWRSWWRGLYRIKAGKDDGFSLKKGQEMMDGWEKLI